MQPVTIRSEQLSDHPYFKARKEAYKLESGKVVDPYFLVDLPTCVNIVGVTEDNKILMVRQYRHPIGAYSMEIPGGFIDANEEPETAAKREAVEETGYEFSSIKYLGKTAPNPGVLTNFVHMFLATGGKKLKEQALDANEEIEIFKFSFDEVRSMLLKGEIVQSLHALSLFYAFRELGITI